MDIKQLLKRYYWRFLLTLSFITIEAILGILFPLFIGYAIDDAIGKTYTGIFLLGGLGLVLILIGGGRRLLDSRFYANIYTQAGMQTVKQLDKNDNSLKVARLSMLGEMVKFMENDLPDIITHTIGLLGVIVIIGILNLKIFIGCLLIAFLVAIVYSLSSSRTLEINATYNNELERQVNALSAQKEPVLRLHLLKLMKWNIKLSDIETLNFSVSWLFMIVFLLLSIFVAVSDGIIQYGALFALVMYVFQFIESMVSLPLYYQQWLRLKEIFGRLQKKKKSGELISL